MLPPLLKPTLREQMDSFVREIAERNETTKKRTKAEDTKRARLAREQTDYVALVQAWFEAIPPAIRNRRYQMTEFEALFPGRYRGHAFRGLVGPALQQLGWTHHRDWTNAGRNRRYWLPPGMVR
jgi:hypothetical protein